MTTEEKALALVNAIQGERQFVSRIGTISRTGFVMDEALCRAIEAHEADKKAFSDAITAFWPTKPAPEHFQHFILPEPEPDPLVEALIADSEMELTTPPFHKTKWQDAVRSALARGYKIERIDND